MSNTEQVEKVSMWDFKKLKEHEWFKMVFWLQIAVVILYVVSHLSLKFYPDIVREKGFEYAKLTKEQLLHVNKIYQVDSVVSRTAMPQHERVTQYIQSEFNGKADIKQLEKVKIYLKDANQLEATDYLANLKLKINSYFWLTGPEVYFEIMFWSLFGVISSILFSLGNIMKNSTTDRSRSGTVFDSSEIHGQVAKMLYAPICTLVIILGYNYFEEGNVADISSNKGIIVFSFLGGFYSGRMMAFLDRLKDLILPNSGNAELPQNKTQAATVGITNVTVELELDSTEVTGELRNSIAEIGLGDASVTLKGEQTGEEISAVRVDKDQTNSFAISIIVQGKYNIAVTWSKEVDGQVINLQGNELVDVNTNDQILKVILKKGNAEG